ncbi:hypothetical protein ACOSQ2_031032 [Xanthoceras sorbifolium]
MYRNGFLLMLCNERNQIWKDLKGEELKVLWDKIIFWTFLSAFVTVEFWDFCIHYSLFFFGSLFIIHYWKAVLAQSPGLRFFFFFAFYISYRDFCMRSACCPMGCFSLLRTSCSLTSIFSLCS